MMRNLLLALILLSGTASAQTVGNLRASNNLSDVANSTTALSNLGGVAASGGTLSGGAVNGSAIGQATVNLGLASGRSITYSSSPPHPQNNSDLWLFDYVNGTAAGELNWNMVDVENSSSSGSALNNAFKVNNNFGGGTGGYQAGYFVNNQTSTTNNTGNTGYYTGITGLTQLSHNDNGTSGSYSGHSYGGNFVSRLLSGATYIDQVIGVEDDVAAPAGSSYNDLIGHQVVNQSGSSAPAGRFSAAYTASGLGGDGTSTFMCGYCLGAYEGYSPVNSAGTLVQWYPHAGTGSAGTAAYGVDFSAGTFTGGFLKSNGFLVDGSGNVSAQKLTAQTANAVLPLQANGSGSVTVGSTSRGIDWAWGGGGSTAVVNHGNDYGSPSGGGFVLHGVAGSDSTIGHIFQAQGNGFNAYQFQDGSNKDILSLYSVASAANGVKITEAAAGSSPTIAANGTDTNIPLTLSGQGTGGVTVPSVFSVTSGSSAITITPGWFGSAVWVDLPTTGPSGIGSGGPGVNAWLAYVAGAGQWIADAGVGDLAIRNTSGALRFSNNGTSTGLSLISNVVTAPTFVSSNATITGGTVDGTPVGSTIASTGKFTTLTNGGVAQSPYVGTPLFGTGADGAYSCSSGTFTMTRDMHWSSATISGTCAINTSSFRIFVNGLLDESAAQSGAIYNLANACTAASGATPGNGGGINSYNATALRAANAGSNGASGTTGTGGASANIPTANINGGYGGVGGAGGASTNAGGAGGTNSNPNSVGWRNTPQVNLQSGGNNNNAAGGSYASNPGSGGGAGGGDGTNLSGAGGGGGGSPGGIQIYARTIARGTNSNAAIIQAKGAAGCAGGNASATGNSGGGGGGAGGGGGDVYIVTESLTGSTIANAIDVSGGTGGTGGNGTGTGKGGVGGQGGQAGHVEVLVLGQTGTTVNIATGGTVSGSGFNATFFGSHGSASTPATPSTTAGGSGTAGLTMQVGL